jgi:hypothetical protein
MKITLILISILLFSSFSSESNSEKTTQRTIIPTHFFSKKSKTTIAKQKKLNFKERLALKLVQHKIKKAQRKQTKDIKSIKKNGEGIIFTLLISALLILGGLISGIVYLSLGQTLLGVLLLVGGLIVVPLIFILVLILSTLSQPIC